MKGKRNEILKRITRNAGVVLSGNMVSSVVNLVSFTILAKQLGPGVLAYLVLAQTYTNILNAILNVQTWESMIMFGSKALNDNGFSNVIKTNLLIDVVSAICAFLCAYFLVDRVVVLIGWDPEIAVIAKLYSFSILSRVASLTIGVPRLFNKFKRITIFRIIVSLLKLAGVVFAAQHSQELIIYVYIYLASEVLINVILIIYSLLLLNKGHHSKWWKEKFQLNKPLLRFIWWTNLRTIVRIPVGHFDMIIISTIISMEMVGVYKVYKEIGSAVKKIQDPINQTIFPEFTKLIANKNSKESKNVTKKTMLLLTGVSIVLISALLVASKPIIEHFFGVQYLVEINALYFLLVVYLLSFITVPTNSLFIAAGFAKSSFFILLLTNSLYLASAYYFGGEYGIYGIIIAYMVQLLFNKGLKIMLLKKHSGDWSTKIR